MKQPEEYVERELEGEIEKYLPKKEIIAVVGARQCGKTTLINTILNKYEKNKKINRLTFENQLVLNLFETDIESFIDKNIRDFDIVFIDEIQYSKESGKKLKYIYDTLNTKLIVSGSSSVDLAINSVKHLVGRVTLFTLYPFSFSEFLSAKDKKLHSIYQKGKYGNEILKEINEHLKEFVSFGGYPRVVLSNSEDEKKKILQDIYSTLLLREIKDLSGLSENAKLVSFFKALSLQMTNLIDYSELSKLSGLDINQLKKILKVLEDTFIAKQLPPFSRNKRTELYKTPKIFFIDNGIRNAALDNFDWVEFGALYENLVFSELKKKNKKIYFWRTKSKAEVDFILEESGNPIPIEVKTKLTDTSITRSFASFLERYKPEKGFFLSKDFQGQREEQTTRILFKTFISFFKLTTSKPE